MADTDQILHDLIARVDAQEQRIADLECRNGQLTRHNATLLSQIASPEGQMAGPAPASAIERLSRRWVLRRGMQAAAATIAAGVLVTREPDVARADADHTSTKFYEDNGDHAIYAYSQSGFSIYARTLTGTGINAFSDSGYGAYLSSTRGIGVAGRSYENTGVYGRGKNGVWGDSAEPGYSAVYGQHTGTTGYGVVGDGKGTGAGVLGRNGAGEGMRAEGKTGIVAKSTNANGYGAVLEGGKAQLRMVPKTTAGKPTSGTHAKGEIVLDSAATLWICTALGTPGTWRKFSTTES